MKSTFPILLLVCWIFSLETVAQSTDKKALREKRRLEKQQEIAALIDSKVFVFKAERAFPTGFQTMSLTSNPNFVRFAPERLEGSMPFFGKAYSAPLNGEAGIKFDGKPVKFTVVKEKKGFRIAAEVKGESEPYQLHLSVGLEGSATLSITSIHKSPISYAGEIFPVEQEKK
ncbi:MAG: DUF4251 domain-containing protein [Marinilabiliales bacterium]|nr:DUF4251 domain-containing protein [Marinilabiliales bacterium]